MGIFWLQFIYAWVHFHRNEQAWNEFGSALKELEKDEIDDSYWKMGPVKDVKYKVISYLVITDQWDIK